MPDQTDIPKPQSVHRLPLASLIPAVGTALLPKLTCPVCWPAYGALLSSLGLGFVDYTPYLFPATILFLLVALALMAWRPQRGYMPLSLAILAGAILLIGKFGFESDSAIWVGVALLVVASAWNAWPRRRVDCTNCTPAATGSGQPE